MLYSRAYDVFITDKMYFYNLNNVIWQSTEVDDDYIAQVKETASVLLNKISHINRIYYNDYLKGEKADLFNQRLKDINKTNKI